ncbi:MAG: LLM class flavin-dependent oxidoreductase [Thermogemmatispora sp.]|jgi:alkanesulfonate monooxygenase SsuD/methylene tetrahydromethanopterin reductase-like flavin-dependent oxidoreductase (luciferase family)|uniref:LLM class flavin-dependent oxidoreductase n=1 Tax=Thermogemmatispora sp. TaxID=1968838 RepID=UPI002630E0F6|nr:LLM class flavin-dependent oxidoreductase [Thermogemmatispora sp.]MBX5458047.1 LLM class flavin-dependent oxidoreductase [Thermogemmatispora sp.]
MEAPKSERPSILFGANVDPTADDPRWPLELTRAVEEAGFDLIGIQDHPYNAGFLDTWTLIATLAQATQRVRFFPNVANLPLRPPLMLAKAVATLDVLSGGRLELGLGAGAFADGIVAMGGPRRSAGEAVAALEEAVQLIRRFWSGERSLHFQGRYYSALGTRPGPPPAHAIGIWLGAYRPRMLRLTGRLADGWIPSSTYAAPEQLPDMQRQIDEAAQQAGRSPQAIRRIYNIIGQITDSGPGWERGTFRGGVQDWIAELTRLAREVGLDTFIYWPLEDRLRQVQRFAAEVIPGVRAALSTP